MNRLLKKMGSLPRGMTSFLCVALAATLFASATMAQGTVAKKRAMPVIYGTDWGLTLKSDGSGYYNAMAKLLFTPELGSLTYEIVPYRRASRLMSETENACLFPSNLQYLVKVGTLADEKKHVESLSFQSNRITIFSRVGSPAVTSAAQAEGKNLAFAMGSRIQVYFPDIPVTYIAIANEEDKAEMLLSGRVDLMVAALPDAKFVFDKLGAALPPHDPAFALNESGLTVVCHRTAPSLAFLEQLDARIRALWQDGTMKTFMENLGLDATIYRPQWHEEKFE